MFSSGQRVEKVVSTIMQKFQFCTIQKVKNYGRQRVSPSTPFFGRRKRKLSNTLQETTKRKIWASSFLSSPDLTCHSIFPYAYFLR